MNHISEDGRNFLSFVCEEYQTALHQAEIAPYFEDAEQDEFLMENLLSRFSENSLHTLITKTDVEFLQRICDIHQEQADAGLARLWRTSAEEDKKAAGVLMSELQSILEADQDRWLNYEGYSGTYEVLPRIAMYANNDNLYVGLDCYDPEFGGMDHFTDLTVNLIRLPYLQSAIDTNNNGMQALEFLTKNGFGAPTGTFIPSGFCTFPVFQFNEDKLRQIDANCFAEYASLHEREQRALQDLVSQAERTAESNPSKHIPKKEPERGEPLR